MTSPYYQSADERVTLYRGDVREVLSRLPENIAQTCITSPPYWGLRDYGVEGQIGSEQTPQEFVKVMVEVGAGIRRVLRKDGTLWLNLGDTYATGAGKVGDCPGGGKQGENWQGATTQANRMPIPGLKPKDLCMIPARTAIALQEAGWWLRSDIIWSKPNPMPESCQDRPSSAHEHIFLMSQAQRYYYDGHAIREPASEAMLKQIVEGYNGTATKLFEEAGVQDASSVKSRIIEGARAKIDKQRGHSRRHAGFNDRWDGLTHAEQCAVGSNKRNVWTVATHPFPGSHFATFPPKLIEPCVLAGTSERGQCPQCGAPWKRITKPSEEYAKNFGSNVGADSDRYGKGYQKHSKACSAEYVTLGWQPACKCGVEATNPQVIIDPFNGAGTTGLVALKLGRWYVGIDLNSEYLDMTIERLRPLLQQPALALIDG